MADGTVFSAFSKSHRQRKCADCGSKADHVAEYLLYAVGDVLCEEHASWRKDKLGRKVTVSPISYFYRQIRLVEIQ